MTFYDLNRFHLTVLSTWLVGVFFGAQMLFAIFSNYLPKWKCGDGPLTRDCNIYKTCRENLTFHDIFFQSAAVEFDWVCNEKTYLMSAFSQVQFFGVLIGTFLFGTLADIFGRKPAVLFTMSGGFLASILSGYLHIVHVDTTSQNEYSTAIYVKNLSITVLLSIAASPLGFAPTWQVLHSLRFFVGLFIGGVIVTLSTYVTELILPQQRMVMRGVFNWGIARIILTTTCMLLPEWRAATIACALLLIPGLLSIIFILPESPTWLHNKDRLEQMREAERYIARFAGVEYVPVEHKKVDHVKTFCEMVKTPGLFRRLVVLWLMWYVASFCAYGNDLNSNTISGHLFVNQFLFAILITISKWVSTTFTPYKMLFFMILLAVDTCYPSFSRRTLHQGAQAVVCACFLTLSILLMQEYQGVGILIVNLIGSVFIEYTWDACFLCVLESIETSCRASGVGSCSLMARVGALSAPFLIYMNNFWPPSVYFSVFALGTVNLLVSYKFLIESKGVDLDKVTMDNVRESGDRSRMVEPAVENCNACDNDDAHHSLIATTGRRL